MILAHAIFDNMLIMRLIPLSLKTPFHRDEHYKLVVCANIFKCILQKSFEDSWPFQVSMEIIEDQESGR